MTVRQLARWTHAFFSARVISAESVRTISAVGFDHGGGRGETPGWVASDASMFGRPGFAAAGGGGGDTGSARPLSSARTRWTREGTSR